MQVDVLDDLPADGVIQLFNQTNTHQLHFLPDDSGIYRDVEYTLGNEKLAHVRSQGMTNHFGKTLQEPLLVQAAIEVLQAEQFFHHVAQLLCVPSYHVMGVMTPPVTSKKR